MIQKSIITLFTIVFISCGFGGKPFKKTADLASELNENSGMVYVNGALWMINDSGNSDHLYQVSTKGEIIDRIKVKNAKNVDWEDLATDQKNHIYIGDFGNNENHRDDLVIYTVALAEIEKGKVKATKQSFKLEDQESLNPKKKNLNYDIEAFVYHDAGFYLFTKNRSSKFNGASKVYRLELGENHQTAKLITALDLCNNPETCQVTGADIYDNDIILLMHDKVYLVKDFESNNFSDLTQISLDHKSQKEAICFKNEKKLYISDEKGDKKSAKLYSFKIK